MTTGTGEDPLSAVLTEVLGEPLVDTAHIKLAAGLVMDQIKQRHHRSHALRQKMGCLINALRDRGMSWRQIYDETGVTQRTAGHWQTLYLAEGIASQPPAELDARAFREDHDD